MTKDDVIRWAREAGFEQQIRTKERRVVVLPDAMFERFAALVAAAEREACAQVCEKYGTSVTTKDCAAAIRARSKP